MKKILICLILFCLVATAVSAINLTDLNPLRRIVQPYVQQWGAYDGYQIMAHPMRGVVAGFFWLDEWGQAARYAIFVYADSKWTLYEASEPLLERKK